MTTTGFVSVSDSPLDIAELKHKRRDAAFAQLVAAAYRSGAVREPDPLLRLLVRREHAGSTAIGKNVSVPHAHSIAVARSRLVLGRSRRGVDWDAPDGLPVQLALLVLSPADVSSDAHVDHVLRAVQALRLQRTRQRLLDADGHEAIAALMREALS